MQSSDIPAKFPIPWGNSAGVANIRTIPLASQQAIQAGAASLTDGFPPLNQIPIAAGGIPPFGQDMNGILQQITKWSRWHSAGGPIGYDAAFAAAIGGYPNGALIMSTSGHAIFENMLPNNSANPNTIPIGPTNWRIAASVWSAQVWAAAGSANSQALSIVPGALSLAQLSGIPIWFISSGTNTGPVTINPSVLGAVPIVNPGGGPLVSGQLLSGYFYQIIYTGFVFQLVSVSPVTLVPHGKAVFATPGTFSWLCPSGVTLVSDRAWGGGGGAGGVNGVAQSSGGSGGGYSEKLCAVVPGTSYPVVVGAGGPGGNGTPTNGSSGGTSSFASFNSATGGGPGLASSSGAQTTVSSGGVGIGGDLNLTGTTGSGGNPTTSGGAGGSSPLGIGGAASGSVNGTGAPGSAPGGGGGGTAASSGGQAGGPGGPGLVVLDW